MNAAPDLAIVSPDVPEAETFTNAKAAVERLQVLYQTAVSFLSRNFEASLKSGKPTAHFRAYYPEIRLTTTSYTKSDSRLSFGHVAEPGTYSTTVTRPDLFANYLEMQMDLLMKNHGVPVQIGASSTEMPVHFAVANDPNVKVPQDSAMHFSLRDVFDVPDLAITHDNIVNGTASNILTAHFHWRRLQRNGWITRSHACRTIPLPHQNISKTMFFSRTTNFMSKNLKPTRVKPSPTPKADTPVLYRPGMLKSLTQMQR